MSAPAPTRGRFGGGSLKLGRVAGVPVYASWSSTVLLLLITLIYGSVADSYSLDLAGSAGYLAAAAFAVILGLSILLHEIGHALVGRALGLGVSRIELDLLGGGTMVDSARRPREELAVAGVGPLVNVVLAAAALLVVRSVPEHTALWTIAIWTVWGNASVAVLNLLPGLPLDGGRVLGAGLWAITGDYPRAMSIAAWTGRGVAVALVALGLAQQASGRSTPLSLPIFVFVALYMWTSASGVLRWTEQEQALRALSPRRLVRAVALAHGAATIGEAVERARWAGAQAICVIDDQMRVVGFVTDDRLGAVPSDQWPYVPMSQLVGERIPVLRTVDLADGPTLRDALTRDPAHDYLVLDEHGAPTGHLRTQDVLAAMRAVRQAGPP